MPRVSTGAANAALNGLDGTGTTNKISHASLHTSDPGTTGAGEYAGVTRQAVSWNAAAGQAKTNSGALTFTTDGLTDVTYVGTFDAASAGNYGVGIVLASAIKAVTITFAAGSLSLGAS